MSEKEKTVFEGEREIPVYTECDLLVVGGGAAGHSAAVAAARAGCKNIVLMERYGYMGGDVTGGYVIMVPRLSFYNKQYVRGLQEEWFTRMESIPGAVLGPSSDEIGCEDPVLVNAWKNIHDCFSTNAKLPELRHLYDHHPDLWREMLALQALPNKATEKFNRELRFSDYDILFHNEDAQLCWFTQ